MNNTKTSTLNSKLVDFLNEHAFYLVSESRDDRGEYCTELEAYSPAGEDLIITIWHGGGANSFIYCFRKYANDFDPDEHAEMWVEHRGENGVPFGIRDLIDDADAIQTMYLDLADALEEANMAGTFSNADLLSEQEIIDDWEAALESEMDYSEIAHAIGWGFTRNDLEELMRLHQENICRSKIEDLLEDCNFHTECGAWHDGEYYIREN